MQTSVLLQSVSLDDLRDLLNAVVESALKLASQAPPPDQRQAGQVLTRNEAAQFMRISLPTLSRRIKDGTIPVIHFCGRTLIRREDLERLLDNTRTNSTNGGAQ